jgi:hypothetical protein
MCLHPTVAPCPTQLLPLKPHFRPRKPPGVQSLRLLEAPSGELTATPTYYNAGYHLEGAERLLA